MNDRDERLDSAAERIAGASGLDRVRIRRILAKRLEDRMTRLSPEQAMLDLDVAESILHAELSDADKRLGPERALDLFEQTGLGRLLLRRLYVQDWSRPDPILYTASELVLRLAELRNHLVRNRDHLLATGYPVVMPPEAYHLLSSPWWRRFGVLYPTKTPVGQSGTLDSSKTPHYTYVWSRRPGRPYRIQEGSAGRQAAGNRSAIPPEETCDYEAAPPMEGMSAEDAVRLEALREAALDLEVGLLGALIETLPRGSPDGIWKRCLSWFTGAGMAREQRLTGHDIEFLLGVDRYYAGPEALPESTITAGEGAVPGAFSHLVLLIALCEWVAMSGLTGKIRDILDATGLMNLKPLRPPRLAIESPYQITGTPAEQELDRAIELHRASAREAESFFREFFRRVSRVLEHEVRVPVGVEMWVPRSAEKDARGVLQVFSRAQESHLEQFGQPMPLSLGGGAGPGTEGIRGDLHALERAGAGGGNSIFRRAPHGTWTVEFAGKSFSTDKDLKGLSTIAYLLQNADKDCSVMDLAAISASGASPAGTRPRGMNEAVLSAEGLSIGSFGDSGDVLDPRARSEYRERRRAMLRELDEAERDGDQARIRRLKGEQETLAAELSRAVGLGDRRRRAGHPLERARKTVGKQINVGLEFIKERHPELYVHLRTRLDYDHYVWVYRSVPGISWDT